MVTVVNAWRATAGLCHAFLVHLNLAITGLMPGVHFQKKSPYNHVQNNKIAYSKLVVKQQI